MPKNVHLDPDYQKKYRAAPEHAERQRRYKQKMKEQKLQYLNEELGDCCSFCGSKERLELDHINPGIKGEAKANNHRGLATSHKHLKSQLALDNLRWLCYNCHRDHSRRQQDAAWRAYINLPLEEQVSWMV